MKLRNKKTGIDGELHYEPNKDYHFTVATDDPADMTIYRTLAGLNEEWEDCAPKEPLIKDEKIRKAVRAWAEVNNIDKATCKEEIHCVTFETERGMFISFEYAEPIPPEGNFTIAELCGEEEE